MMLNTLPGLQIALADRGRKALGTMGEMVARSLFLKAGYAVVTTREKEYRGDLVIIDQDTGERFKIEVKTARQAIDGRWHFTLWKKGKTNHLHSDYVVLLPVLKSGRVVPFVVPMERLAHQKQCVIGSHPEAYTGKLADYRRTVQEFRL